MRMIATDMPEFLANPALVPDARERIRLLDHVGICESCMTLVFGALQRIADDNEANGEVSSVVSSSCVKLRALPPTA